MQSEITYGTWLKIALKFAELFVTEFCTQKEKHQM